MNCNKLDATLSTCVGNNPQLKSPPPRNASHPWSRGINSQKITTQRQNKNELATPTFALRYSVRITPWRWRPASRLSLKLTAAKSSPGKISPWTHIHAAAKKLYWLQGTWKAANTHASRRSEVTAAGDSSKTQKFTVTSPWPASSRNKLGAATTGTSSTRNRDSRSKLFLATNLPSSNLSHPYRCNFSTRIDRVPGAYGPRIHPRTRARSSH